MTADASLSGSVQTWSGVRLLADKGRTDFLPALSVKRAEYLNLKVN
jgi:hypothetical protein